MEREPLVVYFKQQKAKLSHQENPDNKEFPSVSLSKQPCRKSEVSEERRKNEGATELPRIKHALAGPVTRQMFTLLHEQA